MWGWNSFIVCYTWRQLAMSCSYIYICIYKDIYIYIAYNSITRKRTRQQDITRKKDRLWQPDCADVTQMSTSASISNLAKITSSNICWSRGFSSVCQFSPSRFLSVSDLTRQANCREPAACQVQHIDTSWGKKVNLCWQTLTTALPVWSNLMHLRWEREINTNWV